MIDVASEELIDLRAACREPVFRNRLTRKPAHIATLYRHSTRGARAANGDRIKLETVRTPAGLVTSREAIQRFVEQLTNPTTEPAVESPRARQRRVDSACAELAEAGFQVA